MNARRRRSAARNRTVAHRWQAGLALVAGLALLAVTGCAGPAPLPIKTGSHGAGGTGSGTTQEGIGSAGLANPSAGKHKGTKPNGTQSAVTRGVLFGGDVPLAAQTPKLGRKLAIVRIYDLIGQRFPSASQAQLLSQGTTALVSLDTYPHTGPSYASIIAGNQDGSIISWLNGVEAAAIKYHLAAIYVTFEHEANNASLHTGLGSTAQFVQAWDHVHALAAAHNLNWNQGGRLHWVLILTHWGYINGSAAQYWPGPGEVDIVGADGYNTGGCRDHTNPLLPPVSPASLFAKVVSFAAGHGVPVFIAEWGSVEYSSPSVRINWINQMQSFVAANPTIAAILYWDSQVPGCNFILNSPSIAALASMGAAPIMQGQIG